MARGRNTPPAPQLPTGMPYGERGQAEEIQAALPPAAPSTVAGPATGAGGAGPPPGAPSPGGPPAGPPLPDVFGPTDRPFEDPAAGIPQAPVETNDPGMLLRYLYSIFPHPDIARLMDQQNVP